MRPKPAIPSHLTNGSSPLSTAQARQKKEREDLFAAIETSHRGRQVVDFDTPNGYFPESSSGRPVGSRAMPERLRIAPHEIEEEDDGHRGSAPTPLATSRAQSPYTQHPTIDFDGLSWPSM